MIAEREDVHKVEDIQLIQPAKAEAVSKALPAKSQILYLRRMQKSANTVVNDIVVRPSPACDQVRIVQASTMFVSWHSFPTEAGR